MSLRIDTAMNLSLGGRVVSYASTNLKDINSELAVVVVVAGSNEL